MSWTVIIDQIKHDIHLPHAVYAFLHHVPYVMTCLMPVFKISNPHHTPFEQQCLLEPFGLLPKRLHLSTSSLTISQELGMVETSKPPPSSGPLTTLPLSMNVALSKLPKLLTTSGQQYVYCCFFSFFDAHSSCAVQETLSHHPHDPVCLWLGLG